MSMYIGMYESGLGTGDGWFHNDGSISVVGDEMRDVIDPLMLNPCVCHAAHCIGLCC